jgi:hypothetical protein
MGKAAAANNGLTPFGPPLSAGSRDAVLLLTVSPGAYTVQVRAGPGDAGVVLIELHEVR